MKSPRALSINNAPSTVITVPSPGRVAALFQLANYASQVRRAACDPAIGALVENDPSLDPEPSELERHAADFDSLLVMDSQIHARPMYDSFIHLRQS